VPENDRGKLNALIEEMVKGYGAAKPAGRPKKGTQNMVGTNHINNGRFR
jgi:hypothetical protein